MVKHKEETTDQSPLTLRLEALDEARTLGEGRVEQVTLDAALLVLERAAARRSLSAEHTVVGFFGATGSGKSTLFNAVTGENIARSAATRPTTSQPLAGIWGSEGAGPLLDWLDVAERHVLDNATPQNSTPQNAQSGTQAGAASSSSEKGSVRNWFRKDPKVPGGLILLDLPDFDSTELKHREIVERLAGMVDVIVWVLDPQKYADATVHHDFMRKFSAHGAVTMVVLNQIDRLNEREVPQVLDSLRGIMAQDGLTKVDLHAVSARTGQGVDKLRASIRRVADERAALSTRLMADVERTSEALAQGATWEPLAQIESVDEQRLARQLAHASGVDVVVRAVQRSYALDAGAKTGWPVTRWISRLRPDPLRRLNLKSKDVNPAVNRTSLPKPGAAQRAEADGAVREFADRASTGAPDAWRSSIRKAARSSAEILPDRLDQALANTDLAANKGSWWWPIFSVIQWLALVAAVVGLGWLGVLFGLQYFQIQPPETPTVEGWPVPTLLVAFGVLLGIVLGIAGSVFARFGAKSRARTARKRLNEAVRKVAHEHVTAPVSAEIDRYNRFINAVSRARGQQGRRR
ncbi:GTP-binding protein EngB required for normal cell division [Neomicrococcus aestuarii]|uniref:GTP-binding protein EngB required for normal cell division n=1 Tax=Neomicrococcus aestuarii TaxID=556325 RepID=A0A7W8TR20_9MICC|nr:dynamin family protein [Neomicrococcus aestuarii]MBB5511352.1 GTP-binding protein EngB required for normal cell division [Neomicrococcus aestuarii]